MSREPITVVEFDPLDHLDYHIRAVDVKPNGILKVQLYRYRLNDFVSPWAPTSGSYVDHIQRQQRMDSTANVCIETTFSWSIPKQKIVVYDTHYFPQRRFTYDLTIQNLRYNTNSIYREAVDPIDGRKWQVRDLSDLIGEVKFGPTTRYVTIMNFASDTRISHHEYTRWLMLDIDYTPPTSGIIVPIGHKQVRVNNDFSDLIELVQAAERERS
jgi:hypothetical protein